MRINEVDAGMVLVTHANLIQRGDEIRVALPDDTCQIIRPKLTRFPFGRFERPRIFAAAWVQLLEQFFVFRSQDGRKLAEIA